MEEILLVKFVTERPLLVRISAENQSDFIVGWKRMLGVSVQVEFCSIMIRERKRLVKMTYL